MSALHAAPRARDAGTPRNLEKPIHVAMQASTAATSDSTGATGMIAHASRA
jgi:hypothetical protein